MKRLIAFLLIVALASCQKELTEMKPAAVNDSAAITATPLVQIMSFKPAEGSADRLVVAGTVKLFTLVIRVSGAPVDFEGMTVLFYTYSGVDAKHNVLRVDTTQFSHTRVRTWTSYVYNETPTPGLRYDFSANPIKLGIGDHVITLKSTLETNTGGAIWPAVEGTLFLIRNPQTQSLMTHISWGVQTSQGGTLEDGSALWGQYTRVYPK